MNITEIEICWFLSVQEFRCSLPHENHTRKKGNQFKTPLQLDKETSVSNWIIHWKVYFSCCRIYFHQMSNLKELMKQTELCYIQMFVFASTVYMCSVSTMKFGEILWWLSNLWTMLSNYTMLCYICHSFNFYTLIFWSGICVHLKCKPIYSSTLQTWYLSAFDQM